MTNPLQKAIETIADRITEEGARVRAVIESGLTQTLNAARITGARPAPIGTGGRLATGRGRLVGHSLRETSGSTAATVTIYADRDAQDPTTIIATIGLPAGGSVTIYPSSPGVFFAEGVFVAITGAVNGALYFAATD